MGLGPTQGPGGGHAPLSEINVTPLVDVMLVLLIIFMVTAPLTQSGLPVDLPNAEAPTLASDDDKVRVTITRKTLSDPSSPVVVMIGETQVPMEALAASVASNAKLMKDKEANLQGDETVPYGVVVRVMAVLRNAGVTKIGIVTDPLDSK